MLVVIAQLNGHTQHRDAIQAGLSELALASRDDAGCLAYSFAADLEDADRYLSVESWTDQASLDAHMGTPHFAELLAKSAEWFTARPVIDIHQVA